MTFPPPNADQQINPIPSPSPSTAPPGRSPRRTASIVALTSGLLVGGVLVGSQFVSANTPSVGDDTTEPKTDDTIEPDADDTADLDKADWMDLGGPFDLGPEVKAQFGGFEACISEQLGDLKVFGGVDVIGETGVIPSLEDLKDFDFDMLEDFKIPSGVVVEAGDDTGFYEFGDGDGTITITKSGDDIKVNSDGDVSVKTFELSDFGVDKDFSFPEITPEQQIELDSKWAEITTTRESVESECGDLLPGDFLGGMLDDVFSDGPFAVPSND